MKLVSIKIESRGKNGWESPVLIFGEKITSLFAKNGSGKTPLIQAVVFCMGYPVLFREDINNKCEAAVLIIENGNEKLAIRRLIGKEFNITVSSSSGAKNEYFSELDYSTAFFQSLSMKPRALVSMNKQATQPYLATLLPIFYLDQDRGYADIYHPPSKFIMDQFVEMIRFSFGLLPKHSFDAKRELLKAKDDLEGINRKIVYQQKIIADFSDKVDDRIETQEFFNLRSDELKLQLVRLKESMNMQGNANSAIEEVLRVKDRAIRELKYGIEELKERIVGIFSIRKEIEGEIQTLTLNEESKRIFDSFKDICNNQNCGLFIGSSESYAKNLLYLKDQLKDLQRNVDRATIRIEEMITDLRRQELERTNIATKLKEPSLNQGVDQLISAVQYLTKEILNVEKYRSFITAITDERKKYLNFENHRERLHDQISNLTKTGQSDLEFNRLRNKLRPLIVKWLDILETINVSRNLEIDLEFKFKFGGEQLDAFKGATKIRIVLAIHAAIFELYLQDLSRGFRFLIFDTPKQQEMHTADLAKYLSELGALCQRANAQLIFSSTEYRHPITESDVEWCPIYPGEKQPMYLGSLSLND